MTTFFCLSLNAQKGNVHEVIIEDPKNAKITNAKKYSGNTNSEKREFRQIENEVRKSLTRSDKFLFPNPPECNSDYEKCKSYVNQLKEEISRLSDRDYEATRAVQKLNSTIKAKNTYITNQYKKGKGNGILYASYNYYYKQKKGRLKQLNTRFNTLNKKLANLKSKKKSAIEDKKGKLVISNNDDFWNGKQSTNKNKSNKENSDDDFWNGKELEKKEKKKNDDFWNGKTAIKNNGKTGVKNKRKDLEILETFQFGKYRIARVKTYYGDCDAMNLNRFIIVDSNNKPLIKHPFATILYVEGGYEYSLKPEYRRVYTSFNRGNTTYHYLVESEGYEIKKEKTTRKTDKIYTDYVYGYFEDYSNSKLPTKDFIGKLYENQHLSIIQPVIFFMRRYDKYFREEKRMFSNSIDLSRFAKVDRLDKCSAFLKNHNYSKRPSRNRNVFFLENKKFLKYFNSNDRADGGVFDYLIGYNNNDKGRERRGFLTDRSGSLKIRGFWDHRVIDINSFQLRFYKELKELYRGWEFTEEVITYDYNLNILKKEIIKSRR